MGVGLKISLPGYDVRTATPEQCAVHTDYPPPLIEESMIGTLAYTFNSNLSAGATRNLLTKAHGYSYKPQAFCMITAPSTPAYTILLPYSPSFSSFYVIAYVDDTNFYIDMVNPQAYTITADNLVYNYKYYILASENGL